MQREKINYISGTLAVLLFIGLLTFIIVDSTKTDTADGIAQAIDPFASRFDNNLRPRSYDLAEVHDLNSLVTFFRMPNVNPQLKHEVIQIYIENGYTWPDYSITFYENGTSIVALTQSSSCLLDASSMSKEVFYGSGRLVESFDGVKIGPQGEKLLPGPVSSKLGLNTCVPHTIALSMDKLTKAYNLDNDTSITNQDGSINDDYIEEITEDFDDEIAGTGIRGEAIKKMHEDAESDPTRVVECSEKYYDLTSIPALRKDLEDVQKNLKNRDYSIIWNIGGAGNHMQPINGIKFNRDGSVTIDSESTANNGDWDNLPGPGQTDDSQVTIGEDVTNIHDGDVNINIPTMKMGLTVLCCKVK